MDHLLRLPAFAMLHETEPRCPWWILHPLLSVGYRHANRVARSIRSSDYWRSEGDFRKLPSYRWTILRLRDLGEIATMFGYTFSATFSNEVAFLRDNLVGFRRGDLLLLDFTAWAADDPSLQSSHPGSGNI